MEAPSPPNGNPEKPKGPAAEGVAFKINPGKFLGIIKIEQLRGNHQHRQRFLDIPQIANSWGSLRFKRRYSRDLHMQHMLEASDVHIC